MPPPPIAIGVEGSKGAATAPPPGVPEGLMGAKLNSFGTVLGSTGWC
ncbi:MAG: hypothetical protein HC796_02145 [Synechococcaceae cyanobacterium RL_1_2]|nr:hypothetical protein [Synechococcaceae cyanobacterium RL_1_2]